MKKIRDFFNGISTRLELMDSRKRAMVITAFIIPSVIFYIVLGLIFNDLFPITLLILFIWFVLWVVYRVVLELTESDEEARKRRRGH